MTKEEAARLVATARELWPSNWDINDTTFRVWHAVLSEVDYHDAMEAMLVLSVTGTFYPRPGPGDVWRQVHREQMPDDESAWNQVKGYLSRSFPDLGVFPPGPEDRTLVARAYRLAGGYSVVNDANYGRRAFTRAWDEITRQVAEATAELLPQQITRRTGDRRQVTRRRDEVEG